MIVNECFIEKIKKKDINICIFDYLAMHLLLI
jgi:hypothetical protein